MSTRGSVRTLFATSRAFEGVGSACGPDCNCGGNCGAGCTGCAHGKTAGLGFLTYLIDAAVRQPGDTGPSWTQKNITGTVFSLVDKFTGATAASQARSQALQAQQEQAEADLFAADRRSAAIQRYAPWAVMGVSVLGIVVVLGIVAKKRKG